MIISELPSSELQVMQYIWSQNVKVSSKEIVEYMFEINNWKQTTTLTILSRLRKKEFLSVEKIGKYSYYKPLIEEKIYTNYETEKFIDKFYQGSLKKLLESLKNNNKINDSELEDIKQLLATIEK